MASRKKDKTIAMFEEKKVVPKMPEGYYSGDKPNPNLKKFVEEHLKQKPYNPETDNYNVPPFDKPIETTKATAIYNMHTYWSKKPHDAIRQYIRHYTEPGDLVLDPFCGSGGTALAALMEGRKAIAIDRSPAATFITKNYCTPVDVDELQEAFEELKRKVKPEIDWLYETKCDRCGGKATTAYTVYSQIFQCPRCLEKVPLFDCVEIKGQTAKGKEQKKNACPFCYNRGLIEVIRSQSQKFGSIPVMVSYFCKNGCKPVRSERKYNDCNQKKKEYFKKYDLGKLQEIEDKEIPYLYPEGYDMTGFSRYKRDALWLYNVKEVSDLFTKRSLWALARIFQAINNVNILIKDTLRFTLSSFLINLSRLYKFRDSGGGQPTGNYYIPQINRENEAWSAIERKFDDIIQGMISLPECLQTTQILVSTQSAVNMSDIKSCSVDYIFTDPPYAGKYQYGELNFVWESWLNLDTKWHPEEIIINDVRGKTDVDWFNMMKQAMSECYRVIKPGRWLSLCYHDTSEGTWAMVQDMMEEIGFVVEQSGSALFIDTGQKTYNQTQSDKVNKRDLVINFRKPKPGEVSQALTITGDEDQFTFNEKVKSIIKDYLTIHPGSTMDHIYDEVVSRMVKRGEFERHNFKELLFDIAEEIDIRWYLKETAEKLDDTEQEKEDTTAERLEIFMKKYLEKHSVQTGIHYSDLFEEYLSVTDKPRRLLQEWMWDYFFKTPERTWRPPKDEEERKQKAKLRQSGLLRKIKKFASALIEDTPLREQDRPDNDITLAEWVRECRRAGLYEQGRAIYEKGGINSDNLDELRQMELLEDYGICVKRQVQSNKLKRKKTKGDEI